MRMWSMWIKKLGLAFVIVVASVRVYYTMPKFEAIQEPEPEPVKSDGSITFATLNSYTFQTQVCGSCGSGDIPISVFNKNNKCIFKGCYTCLEAALK